MALTPEEKRARDRERQRAYRQARKEKPTLKALPQIGPDATAVTPKRVTRRVTDDVTDGVKDPGAGVTPGANLAALDELLAELQVPVTQKPRVALLRTLAQDLDDRSAVPQRSSLSAKYDEQLEKLIAATRPRERDELDELRRRFYQGDIGGIEDDPEARERPARKAAGGSPRSRS